MSVKEAIMKNLEKGDSLEKTFAAVYRVQDGSNGIAIIWRSVNGYLAFSKMKVLFIREKGLFKKTFKVVFELSYANIDLARASVFGDYDFDISGKGGAYYNFVLSDVPAKAVEEQVKTYIDMYISKYKKWRARNKVPRGYYE